jgi:hypothetical protein
VENFEVILQNHDLCLPIEAKDRTGKYFHPKSSDLKSPKIHLIDAPVEISSTLLLERALKEKYSTSLPTRSMQS